MKKWFCILVFILVLLALACAPKPMVQSNFSEKTTTENKTIIRDTIFQVAQENATLAASLNELKNGVKVLKNKRARVQVELKRDTLYAECQCDSVAIKAQLFDQYISTLIERKKETTITEFKRMGLFKQLGVFAFILLILAFVIGIGIAVKKIFLI